MTTIPRSRAPCRLTIDNIRGTTHESLLLTPGTVTDIGRPHGGGKTTVGAALAACFGREPDPLGFGATPKDRARYLHRGATASEHPCAARIACDTDRWEIVWHPLLATVEVHGNAPRISTLAAWFARDWAHGTHEDRARRWHQALAPTPPSAADVERRLREHCRVPEDDIAPIANVIANALPDRYDVACDYAHHLAVKHQKQAQQRWMDIVRDAGDPKSRFGIRMAERWTPPHWTQELADLDTADLERAIERTQAEIDITRGELAALEAARTATADHKRQMQDIASRIETLRARQNELSSADATALARAC